MIAVAPTAPVTSNKSAVQFAAAGAVLLERLVAGIKGAVLRRELKDAAACLTSAPVTVALRKGELRVNESVVSPDIARAWVEHLGSAGLTSVTFARETSDRELLLFAALLVAPGERGAFKRLWLECGAWRIHVTCPEDSLDVARERPAVRSTDPSAVLRDIVASVGRDSLDPGDAILSELKRHGAPATAALLEQLAVTTQGARRRYLFEAILAVCDGEEHLIAALEHPQWYMVRNAVALLGEMRINSADEQLATLLDHPDARVRAALVTSLGQLDTEVARVGLVRAVRDNVAEVRARAWDAWAMCSEAPPANELDAALRHDDLPEVKRAMLDCTASFPELDVGGGLVRFCAREFTRRDNPALMAYGVEQLARRRPQSAVAFVKRMPALSPT